MLLLGHAATALAGGRIVVVADDTTTSRQVHQLLSVELRATGLFEAPASAIGLTQKSGGEGAATNSVAAAASAVQVDVAVAVGASALRQLLQQATPKQIIVVLITRSALDEELARLPAKSGREIHAIVLDQPLGRYLDLMRLAFPQRQRVGLLLGPGGVPQQKSLERLASEREMSVSVAHVNEDVVFIPQLERLLTQCDVLLALPDTSVHNRNTVQPLLLTTYRAGVPVVAYSEAYAQAGALLALYSTPAQLARQTAEVVHSLTLGRNAPVIQGPRYFSVSVNGSVARSLGLTLPPGDVLRDRLQQGAAATE